MRVRRRGQGIGEVGTTTIHCARILPVVPSVACSSRVVGGPLIQIPTYCATYCTLMLAEGEIIMHTHASPLTTWCKDA